MPARETRQGQRRTPRREPCDKHPDGEHVLLYPRQEHCDFCRPHDQRLALNRQRDYQKRKRKKRDDAQRAKTTSPVTQALPGDVVRGITREIKRIRPAPGEIDKIVRAAATDPTYLAGNLDSDTLALVQRLLGHIDQLAAHCHRLDTGLGHVADHLGTTTPRRGT